MSDLKVQMASPIGAVETRADCVCSLTFLECLAARVSHLENTVVALCQETQETSSDLQQSAVLFWKMQEEERTTVTKVTRLRLYPAKQPHVETMIFFSVLDALWEQEEKTGDANTRSLHTGTVLHHCLLNEIDGHSDGKTL